MPTLLHIYPLLPKQCGIVSYSNTRGHMSPALATLTVSKQRLTTDSLGSMTLTLTNVVAGSRYRIERQGDGSLATPTANAEGTAGASTVEITLDYYSAGNVNNDLKIKVRKGTAAPKYQPFETLATVGAVAQSAYIAQVADLIA